MSRIKNAVKKNLWKTLTPVERHNVFMYGDAERWSVSFAWQIFRVMQGIEERKNPKSIIQHWEFVVNTTKENEFKSLELSEKELRRWRRKLPSLLKKSRQPIKIFTKSKKNSLEWEIQNFMRAAADLLFESYKSRSGAHLRSLANAVERVFSLPTKNSGLGCFVDEHRFWLNAFLHKETPPPNARLTNEPKDLTFSQIRNAFDNFFPDNNIDEKTLRDMVVKEMGFRCQPEKRGPKGPRITR
jgi:hypothetical protein